MNPRIELDLKGVNVLIVDDAPDNRLLVSRFLSIAGATVATATNASEGISGALGGDFDVVLMDIQMPGMDGYEAVRRLRNLRYTTPVVALTAHAMGSERSRCLAAGFDEYLTKPIARAHLIETVKRLALNQKQASGASIQPLDTQPDQAQPPARQAESQNQGHTKDSPEDRR